MTADPWMSSCAGKFAPHAKASDIGVKKTPVTYGHAQNALETTSCSRDG